MTQTMNGITRLMVAVLTVTLGGAVFTGCGGDGTRTGSADASIDSSSDAAASDASEAGTDSAIPTDGAVDSGADSAPLDAGPAAPTCSACTSDGECGSGRCVSFPDGRMGCLPTCLSDLPVCDDPGFRCAFEPTVTDTTVCIPFEGCCVDEDADGFGQGVSCTAMDCDDTNELVHPGAVEVCNGVDDNCDGVVDEGFDLNTDLAHCGSCDAVCAPLNATGACGSGTCSVATCAAGYLDCDGDAISGCEVISTTLTDCGACGTPCAPAHASGDCSSGACAVAACTVGYADCDADATNGCEVSTTTLTDCDACGTSCAPAHASGDCSSGACAVAACTVGYADCDADAANGCEVSTTTLTDCGSCGAVCAPAHATGTCGSGTCAVATCDAGWGDCDGNAANGCEADLSAGCGTNPNACLAGVLACVAGAPSCVDDPGSPRGAGTPCLGGVCDGAGTCTSTPVDCVGAWGSCSATCDGTQTFSISTPAASGGAPCVATDGATRSCNTSRRYVCPAGYSWSGLSLDCFSLDSSMTATEMCCLPGSATVRCVVGGANVSGCIAVSAPSQTCF